MAFVMVSAGGDAPAKLHTVVRIGGVKMCHWCDKYGEGNPWYLNPKNYALQAAKKMVKIAKPIARIDCIWRRAFRATLEDGEHRRVLAWA